MPGKKYMKIIKQIFGIKITVQPKQFFLLFPFLGRFDTTTISGAILIKFYQKKSEDIERYIFPFIYLTSLSTYSLL